MSKIKLITFSEPHWWEEQRWFDGQMEARNSFEKTVILVMKVNELIGVVNELVELKGKRRKR